MEHRRKSVPLLNRWRSIKKNARRNVKKEMIVYYNSEVHKEEIHGQNVGQVTSEISDASEKDHQQQTEIDQQQFQPEEHQSQTEEQQSQTEEHESQTEEQQSQTSGEKYVKELWEKVTSNWDIELSEENISDTDRNEMFRESILYQIKSWASNHSITHMAIHDLMKLLNEEISNINLPIDGRTVMETPRQIKIVDNIVLGGKYWHYGVQKALFNALANENIKNDMTIHLTINIDGLPLYNSSQIEFWPILVKVFEYDHIPPLIIGIYCGRGKQ